MPKAIKATNKNRSHGKIDKLPDVLRKQVEEKLLEGFTYVEISNFLKNMGHSVSHVSVHRFGKPFLKKFEAVRMAKEYAQLLAEDNAERPTTELNEANNALASQLIMEMLVDEGMEIKDVINSVKAIALLQQAQVQNERLKITSRKEAGAIKAAMNMLKTRVFSEIQNSHPDIAAKMIQIADDVAAEVESGQVK